LKDSPGFRRWTGGAAVILDEEAAILESLILKRLSFLLSANFDESADRSSMHTCRHQILTPTTALNMSEVPILPSKDVLEHVVDVHCHPTDEIEIADDVMNSLHIKICAMATNSNDQQRVADLAKRFPDNVCTILIFLRK
jgi:hypothetical protein